jgi:AAHS family 4-hydroxybenzoate transporter-like MFS transporter
MRHNVPEGSSFEDTAERKTPGVSPVRALFSPLHARDTAGLWFAFLFCLGSIYLVFGWLPTMLTSQGMDVGFASAGLAAYNFGALFGVLIWAVLMAVYGSRRPLLFAALATAAASLCVLAVPVTASTQNLLLGILALNGLLANALQTSMYALAAHVYPTPVRATGIAYAAGIGRAGGVLSSTLGAGLIALGSLAYWGSIAVCMFLAFVGLAIVRNHFAGRVRHEAAERSAA